MTNHQLLKENLGHMYLNRNGFHKERSHTKIILKTVCKHSVCQFYKLTFICKKEVLHFQGLRSFDSHRFHRKYVFEDCVRVCLLLPQYKFPPS